MDFTAPIMIAEKIHWVGKYLENDPFQCHPYFIENGDASVLVDPGSMLEFEAVVEKVNAISSMRSVKYIILHHQDPDLAAAVPEMEKLIDREDLRIVTHSRMVPLVKHYMITSPYYEIDKMEHRLDDGDLHLEFITTPYCHSPGAFVSYEPLSKTLFSGDIFGGIEESWEFYADDDYFDKAKQFHAEYMPSKDIFNYALAKIERLDMELIAPQHGSLIKRARIYPLIEKMKGLECGLYIEKGYNEQLTDTIEALKQKDRALLESLSHSQMLMDSMHEAVLVSSIEEGIIDMNLAAERIFGYTKPELMQRRLLDLVSDSSATLYSQALTANDVDSLEIELIRQDGTVFPALVGGRNSYRDHRPVRITTVIDLSELKEKEKLLFQKARMADMGEMIGNIAHQWRQPLSMLNMSIAVLKEKNERDLLTKAELDEKFNALEKSVQYMSGTMEDFMSFYRPNKQKERFCVCEAVDKALEIIRPDLPEQGITLEYTPMYDYHVHGYMNEYTQVVVSLLTNAKDLLVHRHIESAYIGLEIFEEEGEVILAVSDNAGGMKPENLARIFEPYFTTKHQSSGTGLGLYIAKMIIENSMGGHLSGENIPEGARFTIALQRSDDA